MRIGTVVLITVLLPFGLALAKDQALTRQELFAQGTHGVLSPEKRYIDLDINGDGKDDLLLCHSVSLGGTGGLPYEIFIQTSTGAYASIDNVLASVVAVEEHHAGRRIWFYTHGSAASGMISYIYFDRKGIYRRSPGFEILTGDGGSEMGRALYQAIFNEKRIVRDRVPGGENK